MAKQYVYDFGLGNQYFPDTPHQDLKILLGGKGAGLASMSSLGLPVPPGFTITTEAYTTYMKTKDQTKFFGVLMADMMIFVSKLKDHFGYTPLLAVRSGARVSMPGMMDTILNVGLTDNNMEEWEERLGPRTAWDCKRRLIQMLGTVVYSVPSEKYEALLTDYKSIVGVESDSDLNAGYLKGLCKEFEEITNNVEENWFPLTHLKGQLALAIEAVFESWNNPRAIEYRKQNDIPDDWGTAVTIQAMVFGNMNDQSGSGVLFTRNPSTGDEKFFGEFLINAQGEDVVAGVRTPLKLEVMQSLPNQWPDVLADLLIDVEVLENYYQDMQDIEFTIQNGDLYILQARSGKRTANAAFQIAFDLWGEGIITVGDLRERLTTQDYFNAIIPKIDEINVRAPVATGLPASSGVATGWIVFTAEEAVECPYDCILVTHETNPDDIAGMSAAKGILTASGGATSHAAVVARAMNKPCVTGCDALDFQGSVVYLNGLEFSKGQIISIDGDTGRVWLNEVPVVGGEISEAVQAVLGLALEESTCSWIRTGEVTNDRAQIMTADWFNLSQSDICEKFNEVLGLSNREGFIVDLTPPHVLLANVDEVLWDAFGCSGIVGPKNEKIWNVFMNLVAHEDSDARGLQIVSPDLLLSKETKVLKKSGVLVTKSENHVKGRTRAQLMFDYLA